MTSSIRILLSGQETRSRRNIRNHSVAAREPPAWRGSHQPPQRTSCRAASLWRSSYTSNSQSLMLIISLDINLNEMIHYLPTMRASPASINKDELRTSKELFSRSFIVDLFCQLWIKLLIILKQISYIFCVK